MNEKMVTTVEPIDGFHPSQRLNSLLGPLMVQKLETDHPDFLPPINPNNAKIQQLFGDQGGY